MNRLRTFVAITLPDDIHENLSVIITALKNKIDDRVVRWVIPRNIHLTLKFLGEIPENALPVLKVELEREVIMQECFSLSIQRIGAFPTLRKPRVIWVGVAEPRELMALQAQVEAVTRMLGYDPEHRRFSAHLTLGRINRYVSDQQVLQFGEVLSSIEIGELGNFNVQSIEIYKSDLTAGGSIYTKMHSLPLKKIFT